MSKYHFYCRNLFQWNAPDAPLPTKLFLSFQNFHFRFRIKHKTPALLEWTRTKTKPFHVCCVCVRQTELRQSQKSKTVLQTFSPFFVVCVWLCFFGCLFSFFTFREKKKKDFSKTSTTFYCFFFPNFPSSLARIKKTLLFSTD